MGQVKPILFNTDMVRAILDGRKTVTRRVVKPQPWGTCPNTGGDHELEPDNFCGGVATGFVCGRCGHGVCPPRMKYPVGEALFRPMCWPGDILYVRETWNRVKLAGESEWHYEYRASCENPAYFSDGFFSEWRPSIHMPKKAARLFLRVTGVRVERLQNMTAEDSLKEGVKLHLNNILRGESTLKPFAQAWDSTIKPADRDRYGWDANPWVWVIEFERISKEAALKGGDPF